MSPRSNRRARRRETERQERRNRRLGRRAGIAAAAAVGGTVLFAPNAQAATFTVTNTNDSGAGSLRAAVASANAAAGDDTVQFSALSGTITLTSGDIPVTDEGLDIQGPGAGALTVSGSHNSRIFDLYGFTATETVSISGLTLTNGAATEADGGNGGAIRNRVTTGFAANLYLDEMVLTGNYASNSGAGIFSTGGISGTAGAELKITDSVLSGNYANRDGGAVDAEGTNTYVLATTMSGNTARYGDGGGLYFADVGGGSGTNSGLEVRGSTFSDNYAGDRGGGAIAAFRWTAPLLIQNSTISGNEGRMRGGGIYLYTEKDRPTTIRNSTITDNTAGSTGGGVYRYAYDNAGEGDQDNVTINSSIVANNTAPDGDLGDQQTGSGGNPPSGNFILGFSLVEDDGGVTKSESTVGSNIFNDDPELLGLSPAGGPTETQVPSATSPVLDAGVANSLTADQRGFTRPVDLAAITNAAGSDATDMGAVERQNAETTHTVIDSGPSAYEVITDTTPTFTFSSPTASPTFECSLDQGTPAWSACNSGTFTPAALGDGTYTFRVRETSGVDDSTPATRTFTVDTTRPNTIIDSGPADGETITTDTTFFTFHSSEPPPNQRFQCSVDQGTPNFGGCNYGALDTGTLADGTWTFRVQAIDEVGNVDATPATRTFTVDTTAPQTTIDSGPADGEAISDQTPTFGFSASEPGSTFECSLGTGGGSFGPCSGPGATHTPGSPLADGTYTFRVRATDASGHTDTSPASRTFTVQSTETGECQGTSVTKTSGTEGDDTLNPNGPAALILGLGGDDRLIGTDGDDCLSGGDGKDKLTGADGKDKLKGDAGKDKIKSRDGAKDKVKCGTGDDTVTADKKDKVAKDCETVREK